MQVTPEVDAPILHIRFERLGDSVAMVLSGELDEYSAIALHAAVHSIPPYEHVYVDGSGVDFIDSHGLAALIDEHDWLERQHGSLRLTNLSEAMIRILRLCRVSPDLTPELDVAV
jgi:anti-anti-sigma factor